jgi:hypothetical protein
MGVWGDSARRLSCWDRSHYAPDLRKRILQSSWSRFVNFYREMLTVLESFPETPLYHGL